jgi:hypothetical protein
MGFPYSFPFALGYVTPDPLDHEEAAVARLMNALRNTTFEDLVRALARSHQSVEDALVHLHGDRLLVNGAGAQLDAVGSIVGQPRNGMSDNRYIRWIKARILANRSSGTIPELLNILRTVSGSETVIEAREEANTTLVFRLSGFDVPYTDDLILMLLETKAGGVRVILEAANETDANTYTLDSASNAQGMDAGYMLDALE